MDAIGPPPNEKLLWGFMAAFERWVISRRQEYQTKWEETRDLRLRLDQFLACYRTNPAFEQEILQRFLADPKFLAHRKVMIDAILASVLDEDAEHGTIKLLTSAPLAESKEIPREKALGGRYTDRMIRNILTDDYEGIARQPTTRTGRESPYRTSFTPDDYAPEHLERFRTNLQRESQKLEGKEIRDVLRACDDYRRVRPEVVADLRTFRDQVSASLAQLQSTGTWNASTIDALRQQLLPYTILLTIFYDGLMVTFACHWFERTPPPEPDFLTRSRTHWFTLNDAKTGLAALADLTQSTELAYMYGHFAALSLDRIGKVDPEVHLWTALTELPGVPDKERAVAFHNRSTPYLRAGAFRQAAEDIRTSVAIFEKMEDHYQVAVGLKCEAEARHRMGDKKTASELYQRSLTTAGRLAGNDRFAAYWNLACSHRRTGDIAAEATYLDACLKVLDPHDERRAEVAQCLHEILRAGVKPAHIPQLEEQLQG